MKGLLTTLLYGYDLNSKARDVLASTEHALSVADLQVERIHSGKMFHYSDVGTFAAAAEQYLLFSVGSNNSEIHLRQLAYQVNAGPCELYLYRSPFINVASLGTGVRPVNLNELYVSDTGASSLYLNPFFNVSSAGVKMSSSKVVQTTGGAIKTIEGLADQEVIEWVLAPGYNYLSRFINNSAGAADYESSVNFYEV